MPDISMCFSSECKIKEKCYRFKAIPSDYNQSYSTFYKQNSNNDLKCEYFMAIENRKIQK